LLVTGDLLELLRDLKHNSIETGVTLADEHEHDVEEDRDEEDGWETDGAG
jgi:hypothetical protein